MGITKYCNNCNKELDILKFRTQKKILSNGTEKLYPRSNCRKCEKRKYYQKDGLYHVYYLPEHHYVGMTSSIKRRMRQHKESGKIVYGYEIILSCSNPIQAHLYETILHAIGYNGFSKNLF